MVTTKRITVPSPHSPGVLRSTRSKWHDVARIRVAENVLQKRKGEGDHNTNSAVLLGVCVTLASTRVLLFIFSRF